MKKVSFLLVFTIIFSCVVFFSSLKQSNVFAYATFQKVNFEKATVISSSLNVRQGPSTKFPIVCVLKKGDLVEVLGKYGDWYAVFYPNKGCVGVVLSAYLKELNVSIPVPTKVPPTIKPSTPKPTATKSPVVPTKPIATATPYVKPITPKASPTTTPLEISKEEKMMLDLVNTARKNAGVGLLEFDMDVVKTARLKANDMVLKKYFSHQSPTYGSPFDMMKQFGINFKTAGENIAGNQNVEKAFDAWIKSEGHKKNILNTGFNYTGIGIEDSPVYGKIFVQQFIGK